MEFWEDNKVAITGCGAALLVLLLLYVFFLAPVGRSVTALADENKKCDKEVAKYYPEGGMSVNLLLSDFESSNVELRKRFEVLKEKMTVRAEEAFTVPADEPQPGFFFRRLLTKKRHELMFYASTHAMDSIDETLGFGENVPDDEAVPAMMGDLASACEMVKIAADSGVKVIKNIKHTGASRKGAPGLNPFIEERALRISLTSDLAGLMKFLHGLNERRSFFGLRDLTIESSGLGKQKLLEVKAVCATFRFFEPVRSVPKERPGGPGSRGPAPTYGL